jgi:hypothetical protein
MLPRGGHGLHERKGRCSLGSALFSHSVIENAERKGKSILNGENLKIETTHPKASKQCSVTDRIGFTSQRLSKTLRSTTMRTQETTSRAIEF